MREKVMNAGIRKAKKYLIFSLLWIVIVLSICSCKDKDKNIDEQKSDSELAENSENDDHDAEETQYMGKSTGFANVRTGPGNSYEKLTDETGIFIQIKLDENVIVIGEAPDEDGKTWYKLQIERDHKTYTGYVFGDYIIVDRENPLTPTPTDLLPTPTPTFMPTPTSISISTSNSTSTPTPTPTLTPTSNYDNHCEDGKQYGGKSSSSANVRKGPGSSYEKVVDETGAFIQVKPDQNVIVIGEAPDESGSTWYKIQFERDHKIYTGYVYGAYINIDWENPLTPTPMDDFPTPTQNPDSSYDYDRDSDDATVQYIIKNYTDKNIESLEVIFEIEDETSDYPDYDVYYGPVGAGKTVSGSKPAIVFEDPDYMFIMVVTFENEEQMYIDENVISDSFAGKMDIEFYQENGKYWARINGYRNNSGSEKYPGFDNIELYFDFAEGDWYYKNEGPEEYDEDYEDEDYEDEDYEDEDYEDEDYDEEDYNEEDPDEEDPDEEDPDEEDPDEEDPDEEDPDEEDYNDEYYDEEEYEDFDD